MKIYLFDIESTPIIIYAWGIWEQNALKTIKDWELLSFSYKELGASKVTVVTREGQATDKEITKKLWKLFNEADVLIAHNGDRFDIRKAHAKFIEHKLKPPSPVVSLDTLKIARRHFAFTSNKLNDLARYLGIGQKVHTGGFKLWEDCMSDKSSAWKLMAKYNKQDVVLLEKVYLRLRKWDTTGAKKLGKLMDVKGHDLSTSRIRRRVG